jgi:hypothetical protein
LTGQENGKWMEGRARQIVSCKMQRKPLKSKYGRLIIYKNVNH